MVRRLRTDVPNAVAMLALGASDGAVDDREENDEWDCEQSSDQTRGVALSQHLGLPKLCSMPMKNMMDAHLNRTSQLVMSLRREEEKA